MKPITSAEATELTGRTQGGNTQAARNGLVSGAYKIGKTWVAPRASWIAYAAKTKRRGK
jgi:hypothetical protein